LQESRKLEGTTAPTHVWYIQGRGRQQTVDRPLLACRWCYNNRRFIGSPKGDISVVEVEQLAPQNLVGWVMFQSPITALWHGDVAFCFCLGLVRSHTSLAFGDGHSRMAGPWPLQRMEVGFFGRIGHATEHCVCCDLVSVFADN